MNLLASPIFTAGHPWVVASAMRATTSPGGELFPTVEAVKGGMAAEERPPISVLPVIKMEEPTGKGNRRRKGKGKGIGKGKK